MRLFFPQFRVLSAGSGGQAGGRLVAGVARLCLDKWLIPE